MVVYMLPVEWMDAVTVGGMFPQNKPKGEEQTRAGGARTHFFPPVHHP